MSGQHLSIERRSGERRQSHYELSYLDKSLDKSLDNHRERRRVDRRQTVFHAFLWKHQQLRAGR